MTSREMQRLFESKISQIDNIAKEGNDRLSSIDVYAYLNNAINNFVIGRFTGNNPYNQTYYESNNIREDLRTLLIKTTNITPSIASIDDIPNGKEYNVPNDLMFLVKGYINLSTSGNNWHSCQTISDIDSYKFIQAQDHRPLIREAKLVYERSSTFTVLVDPDVYANMSDSKLHYIKNPTVIDVTTNSDLPSHTHNEIVEIAVSLARESFPSAPNMIEKEKDKLVKS